jgi:hypothetical protein
MPFFLSGGFAPADPYTLRRAPLRRRAPFAWLASLTRFFLRTAATFASIVRFFLQEIRVIRVYRRDPRNPR